MVDHFTIVNYRRYISRYVLCYEARIKEKPVVRRLRTTIDFRMIVLLDYNISRHPRMYHANVVVRSGFTKLDIE